MKGKLDILDRKILYELDLNSRQPLSVLEKKVGRSRNVIEYRIQRLKEKGIIKDFVTLLDAGKLGLMIWNVYLEFQNITPEIENELLQNLQENKRVWWVAQTTGKWNLIYSICVHDIKEFYETVAEFNGKYGQYILNQSLAAHVEVEVFSRGYLLDKPSEGVTWYREYFPLELDAVDKKILKELACNSRMQNVVLANKLGLSARIVAYRIQQLLKKGIITRFRTIINSSKYGYGYYKVLVNLKNLSKTHDNRLKEYCRTLGKVTLYEKKIGPWMLELEMDVESYEEVNKLMKKMKEKNPDYIVSYDIMLITNEPKGELDLTQQLSITSKNNPQ